MATYLHEFFKTCDLEGSRSVDRESFRGLCSRFSISAKDSDLIFEDLDHDHDGRISFADFSRGFSEYLSNAEARDQEDLVQSSDVLTEEETVKHHVWTALTSEAERVGKKNSDEGKLTWLLGELQMSEQRHLVPYLETAVEELLGNLKQLQEEKSQLEDTWQREKHEHERHLKRMEEELDSQVKDVEMRMRLKAQAEVEDERRSLQSKMDAEMDNLQAHLLLFEKVNSWLQSHPSDAHDIKLDEVKTKLDEAVHENRQLRMSLLDTQTSIALVRSELLQLRTLYEEKCRELSSEREKILEVLHEQDHLTRQLNLLHDVNRRLQDANDALRNSMENNNNYKGSKQNLSFPPYRSKSGSIVGDYLDLGIHPGILSKYKGAGDEEYEEDGDDPRSTSLKKARSMDLDTVPEPAHESYDDVPGYPWKPVCSSQRKSFDDHLKNASDSGVSMAPDSLEVDDGAVDLSPKSPIIDNIISYTDENQCDSPKKKHEVNGIISSLTPCFSKPALVETSTPRKEAEIRLTSISKDRRGEDEVAEEFPRRKISDIIKQLGLQDTTTISWSRNPSPNFKRSTDETTRDLRNEFQERETKSSPKPVPLPRMSKMQQLTPQQAEENDACRENEKANSTVHAILNGNATDYKEDNNAENVSSGEELCQSCDCDLDEKSFEPDGPEEEAFKVVFVGDAGVGKSSFALRISKGVFVPQMSSTLGVDFLMRTLRVDGRNFAVQLWDTAGQERFRSITKSYFRKADGVLLLYDCTCEQSFLSVRQWVEDVDVACFYRLMARQTTSSNRSVSSNKIPLMIVANKIDLRPMAVRTGQRCISTEEGEKLAKDCDTTFIEASAKEGSNVLQALARLIRIMSGHRDLQMTASTMQLCAEKPKKTGSCCGK